MKQRLKVTLECGMGGLGEPQLQNHPLSMGVIKVELIPPLFNNSHPCHPCTTGTLNSYSPSLHMLFCLTSTIPTPVSLPMTFILKTELF